MRLISKILLSVITLWWAALVDGATYYVTQAGAGSANGSTLGNAWSAANFNTAGNWSAVSGTAGKISPDDTVSLNGTLTPNVLATQGPGLSGHKITLLFASGAKISGSGWTGNGIAVNHDYITVDGGSNGLIENLANGTGLANQTDSTGVFVNSVTDCTVQNLTISPMYVRIRGTEQNSYGNGVFAGGSGNCNNLVVNNCTMNNMVQGIIYSYRNGAVNATFSNNTINFINWGAAIGNGGGFGSTGDSLAGVRIFGNTIGNNANWDDTSITNAFHHNEIFLYGNNNDGKITDIQIYNNTIGPGFGTTNTSAIYINAGIGDPYIFNNLFVPASGESVANGMITLRGFYYSNTVHIYNNTCVAPGAGSPGPMIFLQGSAGITLTANVKNNVTTGSWYSNVTVDTSVGPITYNGFHNIYFNAPHFGDAGGQETLASWQAFGAGFDNDAVTTDPKLNASTYIPAVGSSAIGAGADLTSLGITALNSDKAGNARPNGSAWTDGAFNSSGVSTSTSSLTGKILLTGKIQIK